MKKKIMSIMLIISLSFSILACGSTSADSSGAKTVAIDQTKTISYSNGSLLDYSYSVPTDWKEKNSTEKTKIYNFDKGSLILSIEEANYDMSSDQTQNDFINGYSSGFDSFSLIDSSTYAIRDKTIFDFSASITGNGTDYNSKAKVFCDGNELVCLALFIYTSEEETEQYWKILDYIERSLYKDGEEDTEEEESDVTDSIQSLPDTPDDESKTTTEESPSSISTGQSNALSSAKNYLSVMSFSYTGLIGQLEYEGYSTEDATYAADNCGADWNEQAAKKAKDYIDTMSFSRQGLIDQLVYDGFTNEQAEYGVSTVGY